MLVICDECGGFYDNGKSPIRTTCSGINDICVCGRYEYLIPDDCVITFENNQRRDKKKQTVEE